MGFFSSLFKAATQILPVAAPFIPGLKQAAPFLQGIAGPMRVPGGGVPQGGMPVPFMPLVGGMGGALARLPQVARAGALGRAGALARRLAPGAAGFGTGMGLEALMPGGAAPRRRRRRRGITAAELRGFNRVNRLLCTVGMTPRRATRKKCR